MMSMKRRKRLLFWFSVVFILGLFLTFKSGFLAEFTSRDYSENRTAYTIYHEEVSRKIPGYVATGSILCLLSGFGLVSILLKEPNLQEEHDNIQ